jgi:U3 small nucleolar RNA-associated protein 3
MFKRDKIGFGDDDAQSEEEDFITGDGEEVFGLKQRDESDEDEDFDDEEDDEEEEDVAPVKKARKEKKVEDKSTKGRYGKGDVSSDEDDSEVNTEDEYDQEGWGRQYYSKPSNARAKEGSAELLDERREEDRELEEKEVRRLQRKAREGIATAGDWGLDELNEDTEDIILEWVLAGGFR